MSTTKSIALGLAPSFGFGDRLGLATPGHLESLLRAGGLTPPLVVSGSRFKLLTAGEHQLLGCTVLYEGDPVEVSLYHKFAA